MIKKYKVKEEFALPIATNQVVDSVIELEEEVAEVFVNEGKIEEVIDAT